MTADDRAALVDLVALGFVGVAAYYVANRPPLRRAIWRLLKFGLLTVGPETVRHEIARAWAESARLR